MSANEAYWQARYTDIELAKLSEVSGIPVEALERVRAGRESLWQFEIDFRPGIWQPELPLSVR